VLLERLRDQRNAVALDLRQKLVGLVRFAGAAAAEHIADLGVERAS